MSSIEYQRRLSEYDERVAYYNSMAKQVEHERARYIMDVMKGIDTAKKSSLPDGMSIVSKGKENAG